MDYTVLIQSIALLLNESNETTLTIIDTLNVFTGQLAFITLILGLIFGFLFIKFFFEVLSKWL